jgi:hypothetical protein
MSAVCRTSARPALPDPQVAAPLRTAWLGERVAPVVPTITASRSSCHKCSELTSASLIGHAGSSVFRLLWVDGARG